MRVRSGGVSAMLVCLAVWAVPAAAHPLSPSLLELTATSPGTYDVLWRLSPLQPRGTEPQPALPDNCSRLSRPRAEPASGGALELRWRVDCGADGLVGQAVSVTGLEANGTSAIVRIRGAEGQLVQGVVDGHTPQFSVPTPEAAAPVVQRYLVMGFKHLIAGADHLLFLVALMLLVRVPRRLLATLTAFTLGHSLTLAAAALGWVQVNPALMELGIALSIVVAARELLADKPSPLGRRPARMAFAFGLLHGLGFAGALADAGLPQDAIPLALLAFNVGIELAQIAIVGVVAWPLWQLHRQPAFAGRPVLPAYAVGTLSAFWCIQRLADVMVAPGLLNG